MVLAGSTSVIRLLKELVRAQTTPERGELAAAEIISAEFNRSGIETHIDTWDGNRANVIAHIGSAGLKPALLFGCHLDVIEAGETSWKHPPFAAIETEGRIYGRGAADMKGAIAAVVTAIKQMVDSHTNLQGDLVFFAGAGEETNSCGARRFIHRWWGQLPQIGGVVVPEPTDCKVVTAHRGLLWLKVTTKGKAAHSATPQLGVNAIVSMTAVLDAIKAYRPQFKAHKSLGGCSLSINAITGGKAMNVVPDNCTLGIDIRTVPGQNHQDIIADLQTIFAKLKEQDSTFDADVAVMREMGALQTDCGSEFVKGICAAVGTEQTGALGFATDGSFFSALGVPVVILGPGKARLCHKSNEYIDIADVEKAVEYYKGIILKFLT